MTIVWTGSANISATNPGSPGDLITLIQWVQRNLPDYISGIKVRTFISNHCYGSNYEQVVYGGNAPSNRIPEINKEVPDIKHNFDGE